MIKDFEQRVAQYLDSLKGMQLVTVQEGAVSAYYIRQPRMRIMSTLILFTPEGIVLQGDFTPEWHGSVSDPFYGRGWFASELGPDYLCEKFLTKRWVPELAVDEFHADPEWREAADPALLSELIRDLEDGAVQAEGMRDRLEEIGLEMDDHVPGWGYDPNEASILCAIQRKFRELWAQREKETSCTSTSTESPKISA